MAQIKPDLGSLKIDFIHDRANYLRPIPRGKNELIAKAIGIAKGNLDIVDATAGLGKDTILLARLGCQVRATERSNLIFPLLAEAHKQAMLSPSPPEWIQQISFIHQEASVYLRRLGADSRPQVVYMDPMYPEQKKSALPRKEMQIFRSLITEPQNELELFQAAWEVATERVVVKRPVAAPPLAENVSHSYLGKSVRYDMYVKR